MKYGNRPRSRKILGSPFTLIALIIVFVILARAAWNISEKATVSSEKLAEAQAGLLKLEQHQADLSAKVAYLSTDDGIQAEMRSKFHAVKDGESVAVIVDDADPASSAPATSTPPLGWWGKLLHVFGI